VLFRSGKAIDKSVDLPRLVGNTKPGSRSTLTVFRRGAYKDLTVVVGEVEPEFRSAKKPSGGETKPSQSVATKALGLSVSDLTELQRSELKVKGGVRVDSAEGPAARAGLREGDVISVIARTEVSSVREFEAVVGKLDKARPVDVLVHRGDLAQIVIIRPAAR
jgi:serine protease Do